MAPTRAPPPGLPRPTWKAAAAMWSASWWCHRIVNALLQVIRKLDRHLIPFLFTLGILCYLDRTNLSFAAVGSLNRDLGLSCRVYGLGAALFFLAYAVMQMPCQVLLVRFGAPTWLGAAIIVWGTVAASFSLMQGVGTFLVLRLLLGAAGDVVIGCPLAEPLLM